MINQAYVHKNFYGILVIGLVTAAIFMVKASATYLQAVKLSQIGNAIIADNQKRIFDTLVHQNLEFFAHRHSTELLARLTAGATAASTTINLVVGAIGRDLLVLIALLIVMIVQDPVMSFFSFVVVPPALYFLRKMIRRISSIAKRQFTGGARILETMQETVQGIRIVKAYTLEDTMRARLAADVADLEQESNRWARTAHRAGPLMEAMGGFAIAGAMIYGGFRVLETGATPGEFFSFLAAFMLAYEPAKRLARLNIDLNTALVGVRILYGILDRAPTERIDDDHHPLKLTTARVEFADVQFSYHEGETVIRDLSFIAEPGKMTALVGPSGGGKSTILNLILRFYDVDSGAIVIDQQNIATVSLHSLRSQIAYVGQDVFLFHASVRENIAVGRPAASEAEIVAAAKAANAHDFIMSFAKGYETPVGEHGLKLSGGERQRIAIARALLKNAPIILLDEATASLELRIGARSSARHRTPLPRPHHDRHRAPAAHHYARRPHRGDRGRHGGGIRPPRGPAAQERPLRLVLPPPAQRPGTASGARTDRRRDRRLMLATDCNRKTIDECRRYKLCHQACSAGVDSGRRHRQVVPGAPDLVRGAELRGTHQGDGARRARPAVFLLQAG